MPDLWKRRASFHLPGLMKCKSVDTLSWCIAHSKTDCAKPTTPSQRSPGRRPAQSQKGCFILENSFLLCLFLVLY